MPQSNSPLLAMQFFDKDQTVHVAERKLPHWAQPGVMCFITWRTWDSLPTAVVDGWLKERTMWLLHHGVDPISSDWKLALQRLSVTDQHEFHSTFTNRWEDLLDHCHGDCVLKQPVLARIVAESLHFFDEDRYFLTDYVVMPNHVHLLASFGDERMMLKQCESWKHFTAVNINKALNRQGRFWQKDSFDHLVRNQEQFEYFRRYIAANPARAKLGECEFIHYSRELK